MARSVLVGLALVVGLMVGYAILATIRSGPEFALADVEGPTIRAAPEFTLAGADGSTIRLSDYRGKVVVLDFWATWCGGCKVEIPWFIEFQNKYKDRGLAVLGVSLDEEGWDVVQPFVESREVNYPVVLADEDVLSQYAISALPKTLLIDREGTIIASHTGVVDKVGFEKQIQALLQ